MLLPHAPSRPPHRLPPTRTRKIKKHSSTFIRWTARSTAKCHGESQRRDRRRVRARRDWVDARAKLRFSLPRGSEDSRRTGSVLTLRSAPAGERPSTPAVRRTVRPELTGSLPAVHHSQDWTRFLGNEGKKKNKKMMACRKPIVLSIEETNARQSS